MPRSLPRPLEKNSLGLFELIAIGVGGMIGGGIFSVLGMAVGIAGRAAPFAFLVGSLVAAAGGYSYVKLALAYRSDGASFTYLERAFPAHPNVASLAGWTVIVGYVGTLALYAFTFGAYGGDLLGSPGSEATRGVLAASVLLFFLLVNLRGARSSGHVEDMIVYAKIILLGVFAVAGLLGSPGPPRPLFDAGVPAVFVGGALIFVAYEGFQLITNAVLETRDPERNIPRGVYGAITITSAIYLTLAWVAVGNLTPEEIASSGEYALAVAAKPVLGEAGVVLVGVAALAATSSAINATLFGASRMMADMATDRMMPALFARASPDAPPRTAVTVLALLALVFTMLGGLETIAAFSSMTFLLVSIAVSVANLRLRRKTRSHTGLILLGMALMTATVVLLVAHLWSTQRGTLGVIAAIYAGAALVELAFRRSLARG